MCESENKKCNNSDARPTIGYLTPAVHDNYQQQWSGVVDAAQALDANLLCFLGGALSNSWEFQVQANVIYDLVASENVDGLVSWASSIGNFVADDEIRDFHERYHPLPMVTIGKAVEGFPGLMMENYDGMSEAIVHLIKVHGCRRLAFISGPKNRFQAQERYRAYVETLEAHGIPLDLNLVTPSIDWARSTGEKLMRILLDERNLRPQTDFDAIVAANDGLLIGVLNVLQERGIHVPRDVVVVGFDNTTEGQTSASPLTSVRAPFYELGYQAVEKLLARIGGEQIPQKTIAPSKLMVRRSCGCKSSAVIQAAAELSPQPGAMRVSREKFEAALAARRAGILTGMGEAAGKLGGSLPPEWAGLLLDGFVAELNGEIADAFLTALDNILHQVVADDIAGDNIVVVQDVVSVLRRHLLPLLGNESLSQAENLWHQARVMIGEAVSLTQAHRAVLMRRQAAVLREVSQSLLTTFDLEGLTEGLAMGLPRMGIPGAYFSLYEDPKNPTGWSRLMLAYGPEGRTELGAGGVRFPSTQLVPEGMWPQGRRYSFVVKPLYFQDAQLGFILCEISSQESTIYETLGAQISNALQGALLVQRVQERSAELARQQYVLDTFMENIPDRIYFKDLESHITRANKAYANNLKLNDPAELVGKRDFDFFPQEQAQAKYEQEQQIIHTGRPILDLEEPDGVGRWALTTKMPLRDEHGTIIGTFGISRDITPLKQAQKALEVEKERAEALLRNAERAREEADIARRAAEAAKEALEAQMWHTRGQGYLNQRMRGEQDVVTLGNNVIEQLCKYLQVQTGVLYVRRGDRLVLAGSYAGPRRDQLPTQIELGEGLLGQAVLSKEIIEWDTIPDVCTVISSGLITTAPRYILIMPFMYEGQAVGAVELGRLTAFDAVQKTFLENALENIAIAFTTAQARERIDELLAQTQQQTAELQLQGEELRAANEELEAQTESLRLSEAKLREQQEQLEAANTELEERAAELEENSAALREKQATLDLQNCDLRDAQEELEHRAEDLARASQYKSEFLANMSHELRTPLNSLLILSHMLANNENGKLDAEQVESAQIIYKSGSDLLGLINEILDLSKVEAGKMQFHIEPVKLRDMAESMQVQFGHVAQERGLTFAVQIADETPTIIHTDRQRIEQVLKNLLSNAFKFTHEGRVTLVMELADGERVALRVQDSGIGMTPEQQARIFEAFQQADGSTSRKYGGTGLGLTISRALVAKLGGEVKLESTYGEGSSFTVYLPVRKEAVSIEPGERKEKPAASDQQQSLPPSPQSPLPAFIADDRDALSADDRALLIVEDDVYFAQVLRDYARGRGFKVLVAGDGEQALTLVNKRAPDAIVLDLKLPGISGWQVLTALKENSDTRHIPVHIMSVEDKTLDAYKKGAMGFLSKPVTQEALADSFKRIEQLISGSVRTLLLVEDDEKQRKSVMKLLEGRDVQIVEAGYGKLALELLATREFDCMILDLSLPDMSGFELLNRMHGDAQGRQCPVIVYTGKDLTEEESRRLMQYTDSVIVKGVKSPERLLDETALFLHRVVAEMPAEKQQTIKRLHDREAMLADKRVLLVDDDARNAFALSKLLAEKGLKVTIAQSGAKALEFLAQNQYDLVLMDIMMPEMDGYEAIRRIREQVQLRGLPVLALTAKAMKGDREKCIAAGASDYLSKPVDADRLFSMLRVWLYR